jgi:hypothetical protein
VTLTRFSTVRRNPRVLAVVLALACWLAAGASAEAYSISQTGTSGGNPGGQPIYTITGLKEGDSFTLSLNKVIGPDTLNATILISIFDISNGSALIDIDLSNDSSGTNRITAFGMAIQPDATTGSSIIDRGGNTDTDALTGYGTSNFPGFQIIEFCARAGSNCAGGGSGGLLPGQDDLFRFSLLGAFTAGGTVDLSQFGFKFQGGADSYELPGSPGVPVAQPAALVVLGAGLLGLVAFRRARGRMRR